MNINNPETFKWSVRQGKYKILIGKSSKDIVLEKEIFIESKDKNIEKQYPKNIIQVVLMKLQIVSLKNY